MVAALLWAGSGMPDPGAAEPVWLHNEPVDARSQVWIAIGMLIVGLQLSPPDALAALRGYAYSRGATVDDIARRLTSHRLPVGELTFP